MAVEKRRGCGYRKIGGVYLVGEGLSVACDRLPKNVEVCPTCGHGIKFTQGFSWINGKAFFGEPCPNLNECHQVDCVLCVNLEQIEKCGLQFVGKKFYTPSSFIKEAEEMGVSKRIAHIPRELELGKTWILLAHQEAGTKEIESKETLTGKAIIKVPAIFYAFRPTKIEKLITEKQSKKKKLMKELAEKGITPVIVPDEDKDHKGNVYDDLKKEKEGKPEEKQKRLRVKRKNIKVEDFAKKLMKGK